MSVGMVLHTGQFFAGRLNVYRATELHFVPRTAAHNAHRMSNGLWGKRPKDASVVNVDDDGELRYWCAKFGCTREQLLDAVKTTGRSTYAVDNFLKAGR